VSLESFYSFELHYRVHIASKLFGTDIWKILYNFFTVSVFHVIIFNRDNYGIYTGKRGRLLE
jgi:hypothetical protein